MPKKGGKTAPAQREKIRQMRLKYFKENPDARKKISEGRRKQILRQLTAQDPGQITHKRCSKCGVIQPLAEFGVRKEKLKCGVIRIRPEQPCKECSRKKCRAWREKKRAEGIDLNAREREAWARRSPEARQRYREKRREQQAARRRKEGRPARGAYKNRDSEPSAEPKFSAAPMRIWLQKREEKETRRLIAERTKIDDRRLFSIVRGEQKRVSLKTIDAILTGLDCQEEMHDLYPDEAPTGNSYALLDPDGVLEQFVENEEML